MPRLLSNVNSTGAVGISSDGTSLGNMTSLNYELVIELNLMQMLVLQLL